MSAEGAMEVDKSTKNSADDNEAAPSGSTEQATADAPNKTAEGSSAEATADASEKTAEGNEAETPGSTDGAPFTEDITPRRPVEENKASDYEINLAGNRFDNRSALIDYIKAMQVRLEKDGSDGKLGDADKFLLFHLILKHPRIGEKLCNGPVNGFRYGNHDRFPQTKCFITIHSDGSEEPVSWMKCVNEAFPGSGPREKRGDNRGEKRPREPEKQEPEKKPRIEMKEGCIIEIKGLHPETDYRDLRGVLSEFGALKFLELKSRKKPRHSPQKQKEEKEEVGHAKSDDEEEPAAEAKKEPKAEAEKETTAEAEKETKAEAKEEDAKMEPKDDAKDGVISLLGAAKSFLSKVTGGDKKPVEDASPAAKEKEEEESDDEDSEEDEEDLEPISARARFDCPEAAKKALEELKEFDDNPVEVALLSGEEEKEFWDKLQNYLDTMHEKGKGKGKDGKGKGKGKGKKGKGWDGKGKGKGKKGKGKSKDADD